MTNDVDDANRPVPHFEHGEPCYLQIPAGDVTQSARFYETLFAWKIKPPDPSFEAPGLFGQWVADRPATATTGPLLWINVVRIDDVLETVPSNGGRVVDPPPADGPRWLATILDPAGNLLGLVQMGPR